MKKISALLWRRVNAATADTLAGRSRGQYDIRLTSAPEIATFFADIEQTSATSLGGFTLNIAVEPYTGPDPVPATSIQVRYMGPRAARADDWYIRAQRPDTGYPLWTEPRGLPSGYVPTGQSRDYIMLVRDVEGRFHARWISEANFNTLPTELEQDILQQRQREVGVKFMDTTAANTIARQIYERLMRHHNVLIYGPPGTGKTHIMQEVARLFQNPDYYVDTANETSPITMEGGNNAKVGWVTFHQSYSYEDFIVGLRPDPQANQLLSLVPVPGILLELSEHARPQGNSSLLIIDEINRGNVSRIFGEFITLLEPDKRLSEAGAVEDRTVSVRLAYVKPGTPIEIDPPGGTRSVVPNPFTMPRRLYTLASMNSVDKSIAPLDTALRRRFDIFELPPDLGGMAEHMGFENSLDLRQLTLPATLQNPDHVKKLALALLYSLNHDIGFYLGPEFSLGQWYISDLARTFDTLDEAESVLIDIWNYKLLPQLVELFHGRIEQLEAVLDLGESEGTNNDPIFLVRPEEAMVEIGASPYIKPRVVETAAIIGYFRRVAGVGSEAETPAALPLTEVVEEAGEAEAGETAEGTGNTEV